MACQNSAVRQSNRLNKHICKSIHQEVGAPQVVTQVIVQEVGAEEDSEKVHIWRSRCTTRSSYTCHRPRRWSWRGLEKSPSVRLALLQENKPMAKIIRHWCELVKLQSRMVYLLISTCFLLQTSSVLSNKDLFIHPHVSAWQYCCCYYLCVYV